LSHSLLLEAVVGLGWTTAKGWVGITSGATVFVGTTGVGEGISVGGMGVAVGMAACVSATIVHAAATAVPCTSSALMVGSGLGPQALTRKTPARIMIKRFFIFYISTDLA
jgi:hypothetical protein